MVGRLSGKRALITGGSRGIGRAIAEAFAREACSLILNARESGRLTRTADEVATEYGVDVQVHACDATNGDAVRDMVVGAQEGGAIDILINNAGIHIPARFIDYTFADFKRVIETNVYSVFHVTQAVVPGMMERGQGRVINLASTAGKWGTRNQAAYNASKHAVVGMTRSLALELAPEGILVNAICPWIVDTDMAAEIIARHAELADMTTEQLERRMTDAVPLRRMIRPQEVASLAVYLASDEASYISGQSWTVDGGYTMV